jgi:hypothetical protein
MPRGPIHQHLAHDHARLGALLAQAIADPARVDLAAYQAFRAGLLRHIAIEEKVLFADARARRGGVRLPVTEQLHADHAALASLLVPSPTHALLGTIRDILAAHDPLEEDPGGLYDLCDELAGHEIAAVLARVHAIPPVRMAAHVDEPRVHEHIARLLAARRPT